MRKSYELKGQYKQNKNSKNYGNENIKILQFLNREIN